MPRTIPTLSLLAALAPGLAAQEPAAQEPGGATHAFPPSTALGEGVSPAALARLDQLVQAFVDDEEIVGAELLVLKNGRELLHEAYGWSDREAQVPLETGSVFCVRSMTKPVVGAALLMLIDDDLLDLDDRVAAHLPSFDVPGSRDITVEQLLMHTSGLPMSLILGKDLHRLEGIQAVAALGGGHGLDFAPGSAFQYSDQGTDTLTALLEVVTGKSAAEVVAQRVLEPLGMTHSTCVMDVDHPLRARALPKYAGTRGDWRRFWSPTDPPLFPFFLGSQGLYSTLEDYARFLQFWDDKGRAGRTRLLAPRLVRKALTPGPYPLPSGTGFPGLRAEYGYLMQLWTAPDAHGDAAERQLVAFGHSGSDGTYAWAFPAQNALVLYFTQSRSNTTGLRVEEVLAELFLGASFDPNEVAPPFEEFLGYYWEGEGDLYRAIIRDGPDLALEILGKAIVPLTYAGADRWKFRHDPSVVLAFERGLDGAVTGYRIGEHREYRFQPSAELPGLAELVERVGQAHRIALLESVGPLRMRGELSFPKLLLEGQTTTWLAWPDRVLAESIVGEEFERFSIDGERVQYATRTAAPAILEGVHAAALRLDSPLVRMGDWRRWYAHLQVIQRLERAPGKDVFLLRVGDTAAPGTTLWIDWETGFVVRTDGMTYVEAQGRIGASTEFQDFRAVAGMQLPFRTEIEYANPLVGKVILTLREAEAGVTLPEHAFDLGSGTGAEK